MIKMFTLKKFGTYLIGAVLGLLTGAILYFVQPVQWKGLALVKIGQIASQNYIESGQIASQNYIESLEAAMERLKSRSFIQAVAQRAKRDDINKLLNFDEDAGMAIKLARNAGILMITVVGGSAELVRDSIDSVVAELVFKHNTILNVYQADIRNELARLDLEQDALLKRLSVMLKGTANEVGFGMMTTHLEMYFILTRSSQLRESLSSKNIRLTSLIEDVSVVEKRLFSSLWRACLFGALLGIILSAIWIRWGK